MNQFLSFFYGSSYIIHSVVNIKLATLDESTNAVLTTLVGSIIPYFLISTYDPLAALNPLYEFPYYDNFAAINEPWNPAFSQIVINGILMAFWMILIPAISPYVRFCELYTSLLSCFEA